MASWRIGTVLVAGAVLLSGGNAEEEGREAAFAEARREMVVRQLQGPGRGIKDARVLAAMGKVPRHEFVPEDMRRSAYIDSPLPIGHNQTISQPFMVAFMTEALRPEPTHRVLEIGTGSGYQAAVLSLLVKEVYSIEIVKPLAERAAGDLKRLGYRNVTVKAGDGYKGWKEHAPFDAVIVTCAPDHVPQPLVDQLKEGGRMIIPVGAQGRVQSLYVMAKKDGKVERKSVMPVRFVPMTGEAGKKRE
ncbi:MAG: protein-L-isoaspartate(D-aspartate) O-methyltransferase [Akkermansiaceae bacterium]|nr:protein-L-isoaspartate(D-aspartate) O-methyltransferase [Akkermansiaceae bacterium]NNM31395.1 protein-L-isoaspartate(D-aspartate) O-methyltransferase [Akkermansiaceae bacterium]